MCKDVLTLQLSFDDMCSIGAACGAMFIQMAKEADCDKDVAEALHLAELHSRIDRALREAAKKEHERRKCEHENVEG